MASSSSEAVARAVQAWPQVRALLLLDSIGHVPLGGHALLDSTKNGSTRQQTILTGCGFSVDISPLWQRLLTSVLSRS